MAFHTKGVSCIGKVSKTNFRHSATPGGQFMHQSKHFLLLIERSVNDFLSLASMEQQGRENVGAILGMATAYQLLKQTPK